MPYADPEKQRAWKANRYKAKYSDPDFAAKEAARKSAWLKSEQGRKVNAAASRRKRLRAQLVAEIEAAGGLEQWKAQQASRRKSP